MTISRRTFTAASVAALGCGRPRATGFPGYAFIANSGGRSVAAVDLTLFSVARQIRLEVSPAAVVAHTARPVVYVLAPQNGWIYEIGVADLTVKRKTALGGTALSMRLAADGGSLWVLCRAPNALIRVALDRFGVAARVKLPATPDDFDLSRDGRLAAASFPETRSLAVIDLAKATIERVASAGRDPRLVSFRSDARQILVANRAERMLTVIDVRTAGTLVHLPLPVEPEHFCLKADGGQLFVTGAGMDAVVVVHPYQTEVAETVLAGKAPGAMAISSAPEYLFAVNPEPGDVTVLEVETRDVLAAVKVGQEPCSVAFTPDNQYALVLNRRSGDLAVIRLGAINQTRQQSRTKTAPLFTMVAVGSEPVGVAVGAE